MSVLRIGATKQYSDNWDKIFGGGRSSSTKTAKTGKESTPKAKKSAKKKSLKKAKTKAAKKAGRK
jgi:hypothetical protein